MKTRAGLLALLGLAACAHEHHVAPPPPPPVVQEAVPEVRLPGDVRPTAEALELHIDPSKDRFSGTADISILLDRPRDVIWLHGKGLHVTRATVKTDAGESIATWTQRDESGFASLALPKAIPAGRATLHLEYDAPFGPKLEGLYKIVQAGTPYAFTQLESIAARTVFPCLDEPGFKLPFDTTLFVPAGAQAIANTRELDRKSVGNEVRVHFAPTLPIPSYLVAFAVGPLDIVVAPDVPPNAVRKRALPLRGVTTKGHGKEIAYTLAHTGELLALLEQYFGIEYPYDKLDIIAAADKSGAMENAGAVMFGDQFVLFDEKTAPLWQKRLFVSVVAHELAHQWVGDLVTAAWWDDIWLNESFATFVGSKISDQWDPKMNVRMELLEGVQHAMGSDTLVNARSIRQPIVSTDDIENAFDGITYQKGGGVLAMFERWIGPATFQRGIHEYLTEHRFGNATADDFLRAESAAADRDVKTPFHTFLDQPGVPFVQGDVRCDGRARIHLAQSRYLPLGSTGDANKTWQIPICARYADGKDTRESCTLLTEREGDLVLGDRCPDWVFPNSDAAGYFRFSLAAADLARLRKAGLPSLTTRERIAYGNSLRAAYGQGALAMKDAIEAAAPFASDPHREVAGFPMGFVAQARDWLYDDPLRQRVESYARTLFHAEAQKLGWKPASGDDADRVELRTQVLGFLASTARDPSVRADAKKLGLAFLGYEDGALHVHPDAADTNLVGIALGVVAEDADQALWNATKAQLAKTDDPVQRELLVAVLVGSRKPETWPAIRALALDPVLRATEVTAPIWALLSEHESREDTWRWVEANFDKILALVPKHHGPTQLIRMGSTFCDDAHAKDVEAFFTPRLSRIEGGPRVLASALEDIRLCVAKRKLQEPSARAFFAHPPKK